MPRLLTRKDKLAMLESKDTRAIAELLLDKLAWDQRLQNQFDDCYSCGEEIENLESLLNKS